MKKHTSAVLALIASCALPLVAQGPSPINFGNLLAGTDSFVVMVQGNVMGFQRTTIEKTETGFRMVDDVQIGTIMSQHTEVELAADGTLRSTRQTGQVRGQQTSIDIVYANGRAKGSATTPTIAGVQIATIDTTAAAGTIDDNLITALLPAIAWAPNATYTLPVFLSGKGYIQPITLMVMGTESLTVPAGTFEVYRVEMAGGQATVAMYVTTTAPHRLVKVAPRGAPLEFVLAK